MLLLNNLNMHSLMPNMKLCIANYFYFNRPHLFLFFSVTTADEIKLAVLFAFCTDAFFCLVQ